MPMVRASICSAPAPTVRHGAYSASVRSACALFRARASALDWVAAADALPTASLDLLADASDAPAVTAAAASVAPIGIAPPPEDRRSRPRWRPARPARRGRC